MSHLNVHTWPLSRCCRRATVKSSGKSCDIYDVFVFADLFLMFLTDSTLMSACSASCCTLSFHANGRNFSVLKVADFFPLVSFIILTLSIVEGCLTEPCENHVIGAMRLAPLGGFAMQTLTHPVVKLSAAALVDSALKA